MLNSELNLHTQPNTPLPIFNNWDVVAKAWYFAFPSSELKRGQVRALEIGSQRLVFFRGDDGSVRAVDGFCPHMGTDLAIGKVVENSIRCVFHHWRFDGNGDCVDVPCQKERPKNFRNKLKFRGYAVIEKHEAIWVYPSRENPAPFPEFEGLKSVETVARVGIPYMRSCHHHVPMINGIDPQHLRTIHHLTIDMAISVNERSDEITFDLKGKVPTGTLREKIARKLLGENYGYSVAYSGGTIGLLTTMKHTRLFGTGRTLPTFTMIFAYRPTKDHKTVVYPIYITRKRTGLIGKILSQALLTAMKLSFYALRDEDGGIYENIRFNPHALLPIDQPLARFIAYVNRLQPSIWSKKLPVAKPVSETPRIETERGLS